MWHPSHDTRNSITQKNNLWKKCWSGFKLDGWSSQIDENVGIWWAIAVLGRKIGTLLYVIRLMCKKRGKNGVSDHNFQQVYNYGDLLEPCQSLRQVLSWHTKWPTWSFHCQHDQLGYLPINKSYLATTFYYFELTCKLWTHHVMLHYHILFLVLPLKKL